MKFYNTFGRQLMEFNPIEPDKVRIYTCGPTVYDYQHIGNYSGYIYWDVLVRLLKSQNYDVQRIINVTDVGHLVSDSDEGEDKLEKGAQRDGKTPREVADFYTSDFKSSMKALNLVEPDEYANATAYIPQQIEIIQTLLDKGFAYRQEQAIYFDVAKLDDYGKLTGQKLSDKEVGARDDVITDSDKHHPQDFALWFFTIGRFAKHEMHWPSPWGDGFPGWHIECSAIVHTILGDPIDIHTGGIDHIGTHHTNEIAQTEAAFGHQLANIWLHNNHMMVDGKKISKSLGNGYTLQDLEKHGFSAMDFKMLVLQSHYRNQSNFSWASLEAAQRALGDFYKWSAIRHQDFNSEKLRTNYKEALLAFDKALSEDLGTPNALAILNGMVKRVEELGADKEAVAGAVRHVEAVLGLDFSTIEDISDEQKTIIIKRTDARNGQDWKRSDELRDQLEEQGIGLRDTEHGAIWYRL